MIGLPPVTVRMPAKTTSTQEKMKQKNAATPIPGAISGIRWRKKNDGPVWPSRKRLVEFTGTVQQEAIQDEATASDQAVHQSDAG